MPPRSSTGWLGCARMPSTPRSPNVLRQRVTLRIFAAASTRSLLLMILAVAAAISGIIAFWSCCNSRFAGARRREVFAKFADRHASQRVKRFLIEAIENQARNFVAVGINQWLSDNFAERHVGQPAFGGTARAPSGRRFRPAGRRTSPRSLWRTLLAGRRNTSPLVHKSEETVAGFPSTLMRKVASMGPQRKARSDPAIAWIGRATRDCGLVCAGCKVHANRRHAMKTKSLILFAAVALLFLASAGQAQRARHCTVRSTASEFDTRCPTSGYAANITAAASITCVATVSDVPSAPPPICSVAGPGFNGTLVKGRAPRSPEQQVRSP